MGQLKPSQRKRLHCTLHPDEPMIGPMSPQLMVMLEIDKVEFLKLAEFMSNLWCTLPKLVKDKFNGCRGVEDLTSMLRFYFIG